MWLGKFFLTRAFTSTAFGRFGRKASPPSSPGIFFGMLLCFQDSYIPREEKSSLLAQQPQSKGQPSQQLITPSSDGIYLARSISLSSPLLDASLLFRQK